MTLLNVRDPSVGHSGGGCCDSLGRCSEGVSLMKFRNLAIAPSEVSRLVHAVRSRDKTEFRPIMLTMARPMAPLLVVVVNCTANAT